MSKLNEQRVEQLQSGKVVLYTGDKKGSDEVKALLNAVEQSDYKYVAQRDFIGIDRRNIFTWLTHPDLQDRPIHPIEWFYEEDLTRRLKDFDDGYKEGYQDGISGVKSKY